MADVKPRGKYNSRLRQEQAAHTRRRILDAAERGFSDRGYAATTVESIAREAGAAVDTVYATFGTKRGVLVALIDIRAAGDDAPVAVIDRPGPQAVRHEPSQRRQIASFAPSVTQIIERVRPVDDILRSAGAVDSDIATLRARIQEARFSSMQTFVGWLAKNGPLREGVSLADAATIVWALTSPEMHHLLRDIRGWSRQRYVRWLEDSLVRTLLATTA
jgi:AcrR family transcriptional regulator